MLLKSIQKISLLVQVIGEVFTCKLVDLAHFWEFPRDVEFVFALVNFLLKVLLVN